MRRTRDGLAGVSRTDALLDRVAGRDLAGEDLQDPTVLLLAALSADGDEAAGQAAAGGAAGRRPLELGPGAQLVPGAPRRLAAAIPGPPLRGGLERARLGAVAALTAVLLGATGVAAAVTGHLVGPVEGVRRAFAIAASPAFSPAAETARTAQPAEGSAAAVLERLDRARRLMTGGDLAGAQRLLEQARALVPAASPAERTHLDAQLGDLGRDLAARVRAADPRPRPGSAGPAAPPTAGPDAAAPAPLDRHPAASPSSRAPGQSSPSPASPATVGGEAATAPDLAGRRTPPISSPAGRD